MHVDEAAATTDNWCWTAVRVVRPAPARDPYPTIEALGPWRLFLGWRRDDDAATPTPVLATFVDYASVWSNHLRPHRYAFVSATDAVVFVVGPPNPTKVGTLRVEWGDDPASLWVVSGAVRGSAGRVAARLDVGSMSTPSQGRGPRWGVVALDLKGHGLPPRPGHVGPWTPFEVHTTIAYGHGHGLEQRIEHFAPGRVPPPRFWATNGGYGAVDPEVLRSQSQAAIAFQFAVRAVLRDSGWGSALAERGAQVKLMGFEANNPLHDDHTGRGAHFHVAIRRVRKDQPMQHLRLGSDLTPHLYLTAAGKLDPAMTGTRGWSLGVFGIFVRPDGALDIGPLVGVKHEASGMHLHVQQTRQGDREPVVAWNDRSDEGSAWAIFHQPGPGIALCSARSWHFLHVRQSKQQHGHEVVQWHNSRDHGSHWTARGPGLQSGRSGHYLALDRQAGNRTHTTQSSQSDPWLVSQLCGGSPYRVDVSYTVDMVEATPDRATIRIYRNGESWMTLATSDDAHQGLLKVVEGAGPEQLIHYNPLTGE